MKVEQRWTPEQQAAQERLEQRAREIANLLDHALNPEYLIHGRSHGFALLLFEFGDPPQPATYISNGGREDMIRAIEEWLQRAKARQ